MSWVLYSFICSYRLRHSSDVLALFSAPQLVLHVHLDEDTQAAKSKGKTLSRALERDGPLCFALLEDLNLNFSFIEMADFPLKLNSTDPKRLLLFYLAQFKNIYCNTWSLQEFRQNRVWCEVP